MVSSVIPWGLTGAGAKPLKMAIITDLHHGLAPDALPRLKAFAEEISKHHDLDLVLQMGDFCHAEPAADEFLAVWNSIKGHKLHVLGNHDMDKVDKDTAMRFWGMKSRYSTQDVGGYRFVILDLNNLKKDGKMVPYSHGNYFTDNAIWNCADEEQLAWLGKELRKGHKPTILISHQPLGFPNPDGKLPVEQVEILKVITDAAKENPKGSVAVCLCGHMHIDLVKMHERIPCYCVNSASYFWDSGMYAYSNPLYALIETNAKGELMVTGRTGNFLKQPSAASDKVEGRSASIADRAIRLLA